MSIPIEIFRKFKVVPAEVEKPGVICIWAARDLREDELREIEFFAGVKVEVTKVQKDLVIHELERKFGVRESIAEISRSGEGDAEHGGSRAERLLEHLLEEGIRKRATDIHLEARESSGGVRFRIDGVLVVQEEVPREVYPNLVSRIKVVANLDIGEKRLPQDGQFVKEVEGVGYDIRVSVLPGLFGEAVVLRVLSRQHGEMTLEGLGFDHVDVKRIKNAVGRARGLVLITGSTGSGKSTTAHAVIRGLDRSKMKVISVEDPIEYRFEDMLQIQVKPEIEFDFAKALRSILRHDPEVILVGEIRDGETADIAMRASITGHLVISTVHANSASTAVSRLEALGVSRELIADATGMIIFQDLVRCVCSHCKGEKGQVERCLYCGKTGLRGRSAVYEMVDVDLEISQSIKDKVFSDETVRAGIRRQGGETIEECYSGKVSRRVVGEGEYRSLRASVG